MRWVYLPAVVFTGYALVVGILYVGQRTLLYHPSAQRPPLGALAALGVREISLRTDDGLSLFSWYLPPPDKAPVIVYFHGNGGDIGYRSDRLRRFAELGFGASLVEYCGYAGNPGAPTEPGLLAGARA